MIPRCPLFIVTCVACLGLSARSTEAVPHSGSVRLATSGQQAKPPWASPWVLGGVGASSVVGAVAIAIIRRTGRSAPERGEPPTLEFKPPKLPEGHSEQPCTATSEKVLALEALMQKDVSDTTVRVAVPERDRELPKIEETTRLAKVNIIDELIQDLRTPDPAKRRKAIWELSQRGDTRAVQPLVDLLIDSDSKQRSLILSALSEIGTRTLKPMTRALAISLQDENAEVRKNAIRDLTRVYDLVSQISHLLHTATNDPDRDVQETARWAIGQLNRIRSSGDSLPSLNSISPPENLPQ